MLPSTDKTLAVLGDETEIKEKKKKLSKKDLLPNPDSEN